MPGKEVEEVTLAISLIHTHPHLALSFHPHETIYASSIPSEADPELTSCLAIDLQNLLTLGLAVLRSSTAERTGPLVVKEKAHHLTHHSRCFLVVYYLVFESSCGDEAAAQHCRDYGMTQSAAD